MAQNITLLGASYTDVPGVQLPKTGGGTALFSDASVTTAIAADVAQGKIFLAADGTPTSGTASGGGGGSSYTLLGSAEISVSTTSTSGTLAGYVNCPADVWTKDKMIYVKVRDKAGKRTGYFYGTDAWLISSNANIGKPVNGYSVTFPIGVTYRVTTAGTITAYANTNKYGVYGQYLYAKTTAGAETYRIEIWRRYNASYTLTLDGTYICEAYLLDWTDNESPLIDP